MVIFCLAQQQIKTNPQGGNTMAKFTGLEGTLFVTCVEEAFVFYQNALGMVSIPHHGYDILSLNGQHFYNIFETPATEHDMLAETTFRSRHRLYANVELATEDELRHAVDALSTDGGKVLDVPRPLPWSPCAADVIDKYGVKWFLSLPMLAPPKGCLACVPIDETPSCDLCIRWTEEGFRCPKIR